MEEYAKANGWKWMENPAYETFSTPYLSYADINYLKDIETVVDAFYNSGHFATVMKYVLDKISPWQFFCNVVDYGRELKIFDNLHNQQYWFEFFAGMADNQKFDKLEGLSPFVVYELLRYDFVRQGKKGNFPKWYVHYYSKDEHRRMLMEDGGITNARLDYANSEYEVFRLDPTAEELELLPDGQEFKMLIRYKRG